MTHPEQFTMSRSLRTGVDSFVGGLQSAAHFWSASRAPLDTYGAHPVPSLLSRSLHEIRNVVDEGPPFSLSDLVGVAYQANSCLSRIALTLVFRLSLRILMLWPILAVPSMIESISCAPRHAWPLSTTTHLLVSQLEKVLTLMARLGSDSDFSSRLQQAVINIREHIPLHSAGSSSPNCFI